MTFAANELHNTFRLLCPVPTVCPCHYRATCVVNKLRVVSMSVGSVLLDVSIVRDHDLVRTSFGDFDVRPTRCPHDLTNRYFAKISDDQWKYMGQKADRLVLLQAFIFEDRLEHPSKESRVEQDA